MLASCEIFTDYVGTAEVWTIVAISISLEDKHQITELFELTQLLVPKVLFRWPYKKECKNEIYMYVSK